MRTNSERYWPDEKGDVKEYDQMSIRYADESLTDDQNASSTNGVIKRILEISNKAGGGKRS